MRILTFYQQKNSSVFAYVVGIYVRVEVFSPRLGDLCTEVFTSIVNSISYFINIMKYACDRHFVIEKLLKAL